LSAYGKPVHGRSGESRQVFGRDQVLCQDASVGLGQGDLFPAQALQSLDNAQDLFNGFELKEHVL